MATRIIPERKVVTCDCCRREKGAPGVLWRTNTRLQLLRDALGMQGAAVASANLMLDLCDDCSHIISKAINTVAEQIREDRTNAG